MITKAVNNYERHKRHTLDRVFELRKALDTLVTYLDGDNPEAAVALARQIEERADTLTGGCLMILDCEHALRVAVGAVEREE